MTPKQLENQRTYARRKLRQISGFPKDAQLPTRLAEAHQPSSSEELEAQALIRQACEKLRALRPREPLRQPMTVREFATDPTWGLSGAKEICR